MQPPAAPLTPNQAARIIVASAVWFGGMAVWLVLVVASPQRDGAAVAVFAYLGLVLMPAWATLGYYAIRKRQADPNRKPFSPFKMQQLKPGWRDACAVVGTRGTRRFIAIGVAIAWSFGAVVLAIVFLT